MWLVKKWMLILALHSFQILSSQCNIHDHSHCNTALPSTRSSGTRVLEGIKAFCAIASQFLILWKIMLLTFKLTCFNAASGFGTWPPSTSVSPRWMSSLWYQCAPFWCLSKSKQVLKSTPNKTMLKSLLNFRFACRTFTQLPFLNSTECYYFVVMLLFHFFFPPWQPPCFTQIRESQKQSLSLAQFSTCQ